MPRGSNPEGEYGGGTPGNIEVDPNAPGYGSTRPDRRRGTTDPAGLSTDPNVNGPRRQNGPYSDQAVSRRIAKTDRDNFLSSAGLARAADKGPAVGSPGWAQHFSNQLGKIPWAKQFPDVASWIATSSLPADQKNALVLHYPTVHQWVQDNTKMGGTPGVLREMYARALKIEDPVQRQDSIEMINTMRNLSPNEQQAVMAYAQGTGKYGNAALSSAFQSIFTATTAPQIGTASATGKPDVQFVNTSGDGSESTGVDVGHVAALEALIPGLKGRLHFSDDGMNFEDFQNSLVPAILNNPFVGHAVTAGFDTALKLGYGGESTRDVADKISWGHVAYEGALGTVQTAMLTAFGPAIPTMIASQQILDAPYQLYHTSREGGATGVGGGFLHGIGNVFHYLDPLTALSNAMSNATGVISRNVYQHFLGEEAADTAANITVIAILHTLGVAAEEIKTSVTEGLTSEQMQAAAGSADEGGGLVKPLGQAAADAAAPEAITPAWENLRANPVKFAAHLWANAVDPMTKTLARSFTEDTGLADMLRRDAFRRIFDVAQAIKDKSPDLATRVGNMQLRFGNLISPDLVKAIMDPSVTRAQMPFVAASAILEASDAGARQAAAASAVEATSGRLTQLLDANRETAADVAILRQQRAEAVANVEAAKAALEKQTAASAEQTPGHELENVQVDTEAAQARLLDAQDREREIADQLRQRYAEAGDPTQVNDAQAAKDEAMALAQDALQPKVPQLVVPTGWKLPQLMRRLFWKGGIDGGPVEQMFRTLFNPGRQVKEWSNEHLHTNFNIKRQPWFTKFTDRIRQADNGYFDPTQAPDANSRAAIIGRNQDLLRLMLTRLGVPGEEQARVIGRMTTLKPGEFNDFMGKEVFGTSGIVARFLPENLPADVRNRILTTGSSMRTIGGVESPDVEGRVSSDPVLYEVVDGQTHALPSLDTDFRNYVQGASPGDIDMAVNRWKRMAERGGQAKLSSKTFPLKTAAAFYHFGNALLTASKVIMLPLSLGLGLPFVIMHKMASEVLGNAVNADLTKSVVAGKEGLSHFGEEANPYTTSAEEIALHSVTDINEYGTKARVPVSPREALRDGRLVKPVVQGLFDQLERLRNSTIVQHLIRYGLDDAAVARVAEELQGGDPVLSRIYDTGLKPLIDRASNVDGVEAYLRRQLDEIKTYTFQNDPAMLSYVEHGYIPSDVAEMPEGVALSQDYGYQRDLAARIRGELDGLSKTDPSPEAIAKLKAKQAELRTALQRMRDMEDAVNWSPEENTVDVSREKGRLDKQHASDVKSYIRDRALSGELQMPAKVEARGAVSNLDDMSTAERIKDGAQKLGGVFAHMLTPISKLERVGPRGAFFGQRYDYWLEKYGRAGLSAEETKAFALMEAGRETTDMYYDLSARSTAERAMRNIFWFAPVSAQLFYHWAYAYPATNGGWLPGAFIMTAKLAEYQNFLKDVGVLHEVKNQQGEKTLAASVPVAALFNKIFGSDIQGDSNIPVEGLFTHVLGGVPTTSPLVGTGLNQIAKSVPAVEGLTKAIAPFTNVSLFPSDVHSLLGAFGIKLPDMMPSYVDGAWAKTHDLGLQYAWTSMYEKGDRQPDPSADQYQTGGTFDQAAYETDWKAWFARLNALANDDSKTLYMMKGLTGSLEGWYTSKEQQAYYDWYDKNIAPQQTSNGPPSETLKLTEQNWLAAHPQSLAFSISTGAYTGKSAAPFQDIADFEERSRQMYAAGVKNTMQPDTYAKVLAGMTMQAFYQGRKNATIQKVAGDGNVTSQVVNLLTNWGKDRQAYDDFNKEWTLYTATREGKDIGDLIDHNFNMMRDAYGESSQSVEYRFATNLMDNMLELKDDMDPSTYANVRREIGAIKSKFYQESGSKPSPLTAGLAHYFDTVLDPYYKAVTPIYKQIDAAKASNLDTSALYAQIASIKQQYDNVQWKGTTLPSPDAFSYGKLTATEQTHKVISWESMPISYLSKFQRDTVGYPSFTGEDQFWTDINNQRDITAKAISSRGYSSGSTAYEATQAWEKRQEQIIAQGYGADAVSSLALDGQAPAFKITAQNTQYSTNSTWNHVLEMVTYANQADQKTYAYGAKTDYMNKLKGWIYTAIQQGEQSDPKFKQLMENLHMSYDINNAMPTGVPLYEAVFFGNFNTSFENKDLAAQYAPPAGVW